MHIIVIIDVLVNKLVRDYNPLKTIKENPCSIGIHVLFINNKRCPLCRFRC